MILIEQWKICLDQNGYTGAMLMDLSKAFDMINHELLIAKLHPYGFSKDSIEIILSYSSNHYQRVKVFFLNRIDSKGCLKVPYLGQFYSTFIYMICFFCWTILIFATSLMILQYMPVMLTYNQFCKSWKKILN